MEYLTWSRFKETAKGAGIAVLFWCIMFILWISVVMAFCL